MSDLSDRFKEAIAKDVNMQPNSAAYVQRSIELELSKAKEANNIIRQQALNAIVSTTAWVPKPPAAITMGTYVGYGQELLPCIIGSYGNISCILGPPKSRKSFLKTALVAAYIGGSSSVYFPEMQGHELKTEAGRQKYVLDIDTEQGEYHVKFAGKRVEDMVGNVYPHYKLFALREFTPAERLAMVEYLLMEAHFRYGNGIGLVVIDGVADLVNDTNDLKEANMLVSKLLKWSKILNCHIITVIHQAKGTLFATGHLGSAVTKKCETVMRCTPDFESNTTLVKFTDTRSRAPEDFSFKIDYGLPVLVEGNTF